MELSIEEILRRLLMLGLPLVPLGCSAGRSSLSAGDAMTLDAGFDAGPSSGGQKGGGGTGGAGGQTGGAGGPGGMAGGFGCMNPIIDIDKTFTVARADAMVPAAWDKCASSGDCMDLCVEQLTVPFRPGAGTFITTCLRIDSPLAPDAGADSGGDSRDAESGNVADASADAVSADTVTIHLVGGSGGCTGRRPAGLERLPVPARGTAAGRWLARAAALEAASVPAFRRLARELSAHGAPAHLVAAARAAVAEEARHYSLMARAARARGAEPRRPSVRPMAIRPLLTVARENAGEGCVRETFGAMIAVIQAHRAPDPELRSAMASIALDETRHARLAWEIDVWARAALTRAGARSVEEARGAEGAKLVAELGCGGTPPAAASELGLPSAVDALHQARRIQQALWTE
jgi:hypothetical protein